MSKRDSLRRAVLIDLDGTLVDSAPDIVAAANLMLNELALPALPYKTVSGFIGKGVPNLVRQTLAACGASVLVDHQQALQLFHQHYRDVNGHFGSVYPGVRDGLVALKDAGYLLACVTNKPFEFAEPLLKLCALDSFFELVIGGDTVVPMKPAAAPLLHACDVLQALPENSLMVGDSAVDVQAARAANMSVCIVTYGYSGPDGYLGLSCDAFIDSFQELPALLAKPIVSLARKTVA